MAAITARLQDFDRTIDRAQFTRVVRGIVVGIVLVGFLGVTERESVLVNGIIAGAVYSLIGIGLVLVHRSSGVFNFAQGEFGTVAIFVLWLAHTNGLPYLLAAGLALVVAVAFGLLVERGVIRPLFDAPRVTLLVATAGVALGSIALQIWFGEAQPRSVAPLVDKPGVITVLDVRVSAQQLILLGVLAIVGVLLGLFFTRTDLGLAVVAGSQDPVAVELSGIRITRLSTLVWGLAAFLGGLAGVLSGPTGVFTPGQLTANGLVPAFIGAILGSIASMPGAVAGGLLIGIAQALGTSYGGTIKGGSALFTFVALAGILLVRPQGLFGGGGKGSRK